MIKAITSTISKHVREHALGWEISLVLMLKLCAIIAIKHTFFDTPVDLTHPEHRVESHFGVKQAKQNTLLIKEQSDG